MPTKKNTSKAKIRVQKQKSLYTALDPHLQDVILAAEAGEDLDPSIATTSENGVATVDVIARLEDPQQAVPGLDVATVIGPIVTGCVEVSRIQAVRQDANVLSLKRATRLHPELEFSVPEIRATQQQISAALPPGIPAVDGTGVIVGVVDFGCDFRHRNFRRADGSTRILALWDQRSGAMPNSPQPYGYGRELSASEIDAALGTLDPYQTLGYRPRARSHGTHVLDTAAGNGRATGHPGVAPGADIVFVEVAAGDFEDEESFGNSRRLVEAVDFIFRKAQELGRPAVVNLSLGTHGGPHDGSTLAEQAFDYLLDEQPGRAIVIAAGNSHDDRSHAMGTVQPGAPRRLEWRIGPGDPTGNELEVWYAGGDELGVTLISPGGQRIGPVDLGSTVNLFLGNLRVGRIIHRQGDPNNGDNQVDVLLRRELQGDWQVELSHVAGGGGFHAWIERDDFGQSTFGPSDDDRSHTLGSISCGANTLVVGSYHALVASRDISAFSAEGPTRDGKQKPEVSAPGSAVLAARSLSQGRTRKSGTSMAAPHVAGLAALLMAGSPVPLSHAEIRQALIDNGRGIPPAGAGWDARFGFGRVDAATAVAEMAGAGLPVPAAADLSGSLSPDISGNGFQEARLSGFLHSAMSSAAAASARLRIEIEVEPH